MKAESSHAVEHLTGGKSDLVPIAANFSWPQFPRL